MRWSSAMLCGVALLALASPAAAHVGIVPGEVPLGGAVDAQVVLAHGCGPNGTLPPSDAEMSATTAVTLEIPEGLRVTPRETEGWSLTTQHAGRDVIRARWQRDDPAGEFGPVFLDVTLDAGAFDAGAEVWMPVVQDCLDGEQLRWTVPAPDERDGLYPAMRVTVVEQSSEVPGTTGPSTLTVTLLVAALAVAGGGVSAAITGRRSRPRSEVDVY